MANTDQFPVTKWGKRRQRKGYVRFEAQVRKEDVREFMAITIPSPVMKWRKLRQRQGLVCFEVQVRKEDAVLVHEVVTALGDSRRKAEMRSFLCCSSPTTRKGSLKALLASAPLDGIDLDRSRDFGRNIEL